MEPILSSNTQDNTQSSNTQDNTQSSNTQDNNGGPSNTNANNPEDYDDLNDLVDDIKNRVVDDENIALNAFQDSGAYQGADEQTQDCIDLAGKIGDNLTDREIVHCSEDPNFFEIQISNNANNNNAADNNNNVADNNNNAADNNNNAADNNNNAADNNNNADQNNNNNADDTGT
jgi:hypothetical protein